MDVFDQTQALDVHNSSDSDEDDGNDDNRNVVGNLKVFSQRDFPETVYPVYMGENVIGRAMDQCQIHIPIKVLSKRHAVIEVEQDVHMIYDCESHNKSYKGSLPLKPMVRYEIRHGEKLKLGDVRCEYSKSCLVDEDDSHSDTATMSILAGPSTSYRNNTDKKVFAESIVKDTKPFDAPVAAFELKSDSEMSDNDDCIIPSSQNDTVIVPETPANRHKTIEKKRLSLSTSALKPIVESDSDTDIELDKSETDTVPNSKAATSCLVENSDVDTDLDSDFEVAKAINIYDAATQVYPTDTEYYKNKEQASTSKNNRHRKTEAEIDWSNLETQPYVISGSDNSDEDIMNMETQAYPDLTEPVKEYNSSEEDIALAETIPVDEVEIDSDPIPNVTRTNNDENQVFASQCSDQEFRTVQNKVVEVLQSSALALSPQSPMAAKRTRLRTTKLAPTSALEVTTSDKNAADSSMESTSKTRKASGSKLRLSTDEETVENRVKSIPTPKGRKKSAKDSPAVVPLEDAEVECGPKSRKGRRGKQKSDEQIAVENDDTARDVAKLKESAMKELVSSVLLPKPIELNPALSSSPKTYSRKERSKESSQLESHDTFASMESNCLEETVVVQSRDESGLNDGELLVEDTSELEKVATSITKKKKTKERKLTPDKVLETVAVESNDQMSHDMAKNSSEEQSVKPKVAISSVSSRGKRKKPVPLVTEDTPLPDQIASPEINSKAAVAVKIPSTSDTPFRRVGRLLDTELVDDVFDDKPMTNKQQSPSTKKAKRLKDHAENQSPVSSTRSRQKKNAVVSSPEANVDDVDGAEEENKVQKRGKKGGKRVSSNVTSLEETTPKRTRGRPKKSSKESPTPNDDDEPVSSTRTPRKRVQKKDVQDEEVSSKVKGAKGSKKQKVADVVVAPESSNDDDDESDAEVEEETEVKTSRSRPTARNGTTRRTRTNSNATSTPVARTPRGKKRRGVSANSTSSGDRSPKTPRPQVKKPKIIFTGFTDAAGEKTVKKLGGSLVDSVFESTHLVTDKIRRTCKLLCMVARGQPVVNINWLRKCEKANCFIDSSKFLMKDGASEEQFGFSLSKSLSQASKKKLLDGYSIHVTKSVKPDPEQMQPIIECAGGQFLSKMPRKTSQDITTLVVSCVEDLKLCLPAVKAGISVVGSEFILTGVLRQEVDIKSNLLCEGESVSERSTPKRSKASETKASPAKSISSPKANSGGRKLRREQADEELEVKKGLKSREKGVKGDVEGGSGQTPSRGKSKAVKESPPERSITRRSALSRKKLK